MSLPQSLLALALALCTGLAAAAPRDELHQAFSRFLAAKSFRASVTDVKKGQQLSTLEFVAPDRYRIENGQGQMEQILIGGDAYTLIDGRRIKLPMPIQVDRIVGQYRNPAALDQLAQGLEVTALGTETVDGITTQVYSYTQTEPARSEVKVWVDTATGLPLQLESSGRFLRLKSTTRIRYYDFDDASIRVQAPAD
jgi:outer membrane lipoprotein-sorting protein